VTLLSFGSFALCANFSKIPGIAPAIAPVIAGERPNLLPNEDTTPPAIAPVKGLPERLPERDDNKSPTPPFSAACVARPFLICPAISSCPGSGVHWESDDLQFFLLQVLKSVQTYLLI
jgi:hypothetical protein